MRPFEVSASARETSPPNSNPSKVKVCAEEFSPKSRTGLIEAPFESQPAASKWTLRTCWENPLSYMSGWVAVEEVEACEKDN